LIKGELGPGEKGRKRKFFLTASYEWGLGIVKLVLPRCVGR